MKTLSTVRLAGFSFGQKLVGQGNRTFRIGMLLLETQLGRSGHQRPADDACRNILYEYHIDRQLESAVCQAAITALSVRFKLRNFEAVSRRPNADRAL
jgi:hypothetical protein